MATSAPVLYANTHHPELKIEYPNWSDRHKQIIKRWRGLSVDIKTPFNQKARENRTTLRMKKTQQVSGFTIIRSELYVCVEKRILYMIQVRIWGCTNTTHIQFFFFGFMWIINTNLMAERQ